MLGAFHNILTTGSQHKGFRYINTTFFQIQLFYKYNIFTNTKFLQIQHYINTTFLQEELNPGLLHLEIADPDPNVSELSQ